MPAEDRAGVEEGMHELVERFRTAFQDWDNRSGFGSVYIDVVMRFLDGSVPPGGRGATDSDGLDRRQSGASRVIPRKGHRHMLETRIY
jgi:hypothetical protein